VRSQDLRNEGNAVFKQGKFGAAIAKYTEAILLDPTNYVLYSNRAACYNYLNAADSAITDLLKSIELNESFQPSWARLGYCYLA
ncbi:TPR-like protein, partial [Cyberlindnera jadinii NRRL Y-1542]